MPNTNHPTNTAPCYRCILPECPPPAACSRCADAGVLGPVPGVIGVLQAVETIKILTKMGTVLSQRMLLYDALAPRMHVIKLRGKRADCIACGENPSISSETLTMFDYTGFTGGHGDHDKPEALTVLTEEHRWLCEQVHDALVGGGGYGGGVLLLDTRPATQFAIARLPGTVWGCVVVEDMCCCCRGHVMDEDM